MLGTDEADMRMTAQAVRDAMPSCLLLCVLHDDCDGLTRGGVEHALELGPWEGCYRLVGASGEDAAVVATDPTDGLARCLGLVPVLCVVGVARETCLGEDANGARTTRAARRAAVAGVPTIAVSVPTRSPDAPAAPAASALARLLRAVARVVRTDAPANCPRSHFPFPTRGRWSAVGTAQLPLDAALAAQLFARDVGDFAAEDCWSLGGAGAALHAETPNGGEVGNGTRLTPAEAREVLRDAFGEGDVFLSVSVPPRWDGAAGGRFAAARPGVLWRQQTARAAFPSDEGGGGEIDGGSSEDPKDPWGRTLPVQSLDDARAGEAGARFVRQLATEAAVNGRLETASTVTSEHRRRPLPRGFCTGPGTVVADDSAGGDVDVVMGNKAAVCAAQTWPHGHAFSLLDHVAAEALREDPGTGLPLWLCE